MNRNNDAYLNGDQYETPFADQFSFQSEQSNPEENYTSYEVSYDSPFARTYESEDGNISNQPVAEAFVNLLADLNNEDFSSSLYAMANEMDETIISRISNEASMGSQYLPYIKQQADQYFYPLQSEIDSMIDRVSNFVGNDQAFASKSDQEIEDFLNNISFEHSGVLSPAQEQFFGSIFKKVGDVVKAGANIVKKGISAVSKVIPIKPILDKIKKLVKPLLNKVLSSLIGKLPKTLQPYAKDLAKKFLNLETPIQDGAVASSNETLAGNDFQMLAYEFDLTVANAAFSNNEIETDNLINEYIFDGENFQSESYNDISQNPVRSLNEARQNFIDHMKNGGDIKPAIDQFLPAALIALQPVIKIAITIIGRQKVIDFLAGLITNLIEKYVPAQVVKPLATSIIDLGLGALGFETNERDQSTVAYEAIANTVEDVVRTLGSEGEQVLSKIEGMSDNEAIKKLSTQVLPAFNKAVANNFPGNMVRKDLRTASQPGTWVLMPRNKPFAYKKYTRVFDVNITSQMAASLKTFRGVSLDSYLKDKLGIESSDGVKAKVHLYESIPGTWLSKISLNEKIYGLGTADIKGWGQIHPLSIHNASLLLQEPGLGKDSADVFTSTRDKIAVGQRFFYLEIPGSRVIKPIVEIPTHNHSGDEDGKHKGPVWSNSSDINAVINFIKSEIQFNFYFSEADAQKIASKLRSNDVAGAADAIRKSLNETLGNLLIKNIPGKVKIVHEAVPELYLKNVSDYENPMSSLPGILRSAGVAVAGQAKGIGKEVLTSIIKNLIEKFSESGYNEVKEFFQSKSNSFQDAVNKPENGVTIRLQWINVPGMSKIRSIINLIKGKGSLGDLKDMTLPGVPTPQVIIFPGKIRFTI